MGTETKVGSVLDASREWTWADTVADRQRIRDTVREALAPPTVDAVTVNFDAAIAEASLAETEAEARACFKSVEIPALRPVPDVRHAVSVADAPVRPRPERRLWASGKSGAVLTVGTVTVLSGEGGIGKSPLTYSMAYDVASLPLDQPGDVSGGLFQGTGGPVLIATLEEGADEANWKLRELAKLREIQNKPDKKIPGLTRTHVLDLSGRPLFGPIGDGNRSGLYNARPGPLDGWDDLWREAKKVGARLVIVDPALSAYVGEPNAAAPVTEFLVALAREAKAINAGVLLVAHSTKAARQGEGKNRKRNPFDPGQVSGAAAWTDRVRGVLSFTWDDDDDKLGERWLAITKANYGPSKLVIKPEPVRYKPIGASENKDAILGFKAGGTWEGADKAKDKDKKAKGENGEFAPGVA